MTIIHKKGLNKAAVLNWANLLTGPLLADAVYHVLLDIIIYYYSKT